MNPISKTLALATASSAPLGAAVVIQDSFGGMMAGVGLTGRTPETSTLGGNWTAPTNNFLSDGAGNLVSQYTQTQSAFIDFGSTYMANNPGLYTLSTTVISPTVSSTSIVGFGFTNTPNVETSSII